MADGITISVTEDVTSVTVTEDVTTIDITPSVTTVEAKGIALGTAGAATATAYQNSNTNLAVGGTVAAALDHINTNGLNKNLAQTVTGTITFNDGVKATFGDSSDLQIYHDGSHSYIRDAGEGNLRVDAGDFYVRNLAGTQLKIGAISGGATSLYYAGDKKLETTSAGVDVTGTITFDGGTTSADLNFGDSDKAVFGASGNLKIYFDGSHSYVYDTGPGDLRVRGNNLYLQNDTGGNYLSAINGGATTLFHNGNTKIATTATGVDVTGTITFDGGTTSENLNFGDGDKAVFGDNSELQIFHQSSNNNSIIRELGGGALSLQTNGPEITLWDYTNEKHLAQFIAGGEVNLRYNGDSKLRTTTGGVAVTGTAVATTFSGDLNGTINTATTATTQSQSDNSTKVATTAYVDTAVAGKDNTDEITEGSSNLYFTNARADARISNAIKDEDNMASNSATHVPSQQSVKAYVDAEVAGLVNGAPDDLNTLHELADALAEDANFSATVTTSIGNKLAKASNLSDLTDAGTARTNLGLGSAATTASTDYVAASSLSTFGGTLIDDTDAATARTTLGLGSAATSATDDFATGAEGELAASALQPAGTLTGKIQTTQTANNMSGLTMNAGGTTTGGSIAFKEGTDNGTNAVTLQAPAATADVTVTLPSTAGTLQLAPASGSFQLQPSEGAFVDGDKTKLDNVDNDTPAFDSVSIDTGTQTWEISENNNKLVFKYNGNIKMSLDTSGNLVVDGNITAFGTP